MIKYNAKDLIQQAQMLADIQNSDFISWKENIMFLDNAWTDLYQQIINHGDKTFLQTFKMKGSVCELPDDFYQLHYISYDNGLMRRPINRKCKTSINEGPYYDIIGNELIIYSNNSSISGIEVEYYPVKDAITYASNDVKVATIDGEVIDVCGQKVLYKKDNNYFIKDLLNDTEKPDDGGFMLTNNGVVGINNNPCFKSNNKCYYSVVDENTLTIKKSNGTDYKVITDVVELPDPKLDTINGLSDWGIYWSSEGILKYFDFETKHISDYAEDLISDKVYVFDNNVYYETVEGICCDGEVLISSKDYDLFNGVMKVDETTGYGIFIDNSIIKSSFKNTELDFPNNFYYNYLAYKLAIYYKIKQGADANGLVALNNDALKTFYDTLPRDENEFIRISNVYAR